MYLLISNLQDINQQLVIPVCRQDFMLVYNHEVNVVHIPYKYVVNQLMRQYDSDRLKLPTLWETLVFLITAITDRTRQLSRLSYCCYSKGSRKYSLACDTSGRSCVRTRDMRLSFVTDGGIIIIYFKPKVRII